MPLDNKLIGHQLPQKILFQAISSQKFGHAYLFSGEEGIGKRAVAFAVAKTLLCQKSVPYCGQCDSCTKSEQRTHPDLFEVSPEGVFIKMSQIKQVQDQVSLQPAYGLKKIFIIDEADRMNSEAANAFLKTLEEPPPDTHFLLVTSRPQAILSTLFSRCQQIHFAIPPREELVRFLMTKKNLTGAEAITLAKRSQGRVRMAFSLDMETLEREDQTYFQLIQPETLESPVKLFLLSEELSRDADQFKKTVEWILLCLRDMILWKKCRDPQLLILDRHRDRIGYLSGRFSETQLNGAFAFLQKVEKLIQRNMNRPLALETLLLQLQSRPGTVPSMKETE